MGKTYKKIALVKYMQYLTSRQEVVKSLYANRQPRSTADDRPVNGSAVYRPTARFRDTMLINLNDVSDMERHEISFSRLPIAVRLLSPGRVFPPKVTATSRL